MNTRERFVRVLTGREVDRVPFMKVFGGDNAIVGAWEKERPGIGREIDAILQFEGGYRGWRTTAANFGLSRVPPTEVLEDDGVRVVQRRGDGTVEVLQRGRDFHHQTVQWPVANREDWERVSERHMDPEDPARFPAEWSAHVRLYRDRDFPLQLTHGGVYGFIRNLMGDEALAMAFFESPDLVHEILATYTGMVLKMWERMVREVEFDLIECWEDMAFRSGSLVSPSIFEEFLKPQYQRIRRFADEHGIEIILVDSDGNIEELTGWMLDAGVTALYPYEVQAGNDTVRMLDTYPRLGVIGGLDKNVMARGRDAIDAEMERARGLIRKGRFIPGPDHFVLSDVPWENYRYFMERLRDVVMTTRPG